MAIRRANRPTITNGHATGTISSFDIERIPVPRKEGRMTVTEDVETYIMRVAVDGITGQTVPMSTTLGMHLNDDPVNFEELQSSPRAKKRYNKLTTTLMKLELIDESELATADDARLEQLDNDIAGLVVCAYVALDGWASVGGLHDGNGYSGVVANG